MRALVGLTAVHVFVTALGFVSGVVGWACAYPVAHVVGHGRHTVETLIVVGFALLPISILGTALLGALWGQQDWRRYSAVRLLGAGVLVSILLVLGATHQLSVTTAAAATFAAGIASFAPLVPVLRRTRRWRVDRRVAGGALSYGARSTFGTAAGVINLRLDQILMAGLLPARDLGIYVVAVTLAGFMVVVSQTLNLLVLPLVAGGERAVVRRIVRITLLGMAIASALMAVSAPWVIATLLGEDFAGSVALVQVLVVGAPLLAGIEVLTSALGGAGYPGETALAEGVGCAVTLPTLILILPTAGTMGAAMVSVVSYGIVFAVLLLRGRRHLGGRVHEYLLPTAADIVDLRGYARERLTTAARRS